MGGYTFMNERAGAFTATAVIAFVFGYLGALAALEHTQPVVKVKRLEVVSESGAVCGAFGVEHGAATLALNNSTGKPCLVFGAVRDEPGIAWLDIAGKPRGGVGLIEGTPGIWFGDSKGNQRLQLGVKDDTPSIELISGDGQQTWTAP
jgi:hypothetical protein